MRRVVAAVSTPTPVTVFQNREYALDFLFQGRIAANTGTLQRVQGRLYRFLMLTMMMTMLTQPLVVHSLEDLLDLRCAFGHKSLVHAQQAIHQVLSPLYEPDFSEYSYGFRPGRNAHQALEQAKKYINEGYQEIIDLDLKSFFDKVNHDILMSLLMQKVKDQNLLKLIRRYLQSGLLLDGVCSPRPQGTPQGGPLSRLLSNILLSELDKELARRGLRFIRYADDCSIFVRSRRSAIRVLRTVTRFLKEHLRLEVNEQKTGIHRPVKFELLGYGFVPTYQKGVKGKYNFRVSPKSFKKLKLKLKAITRKTYPMSFDVRMDKLLALMRGWVNYFKLAKMWRKLKELDVWIRTRLRYCIWKQWKRPNRRMKNFIRMGVEHGLAYAWSRSRLGGWRIACSPIMKTTVTLDRLARRGCQSFEQYYLKRIHV